MWHHPKYYKELRKRNKETQQELQRILDKPGRSVSNSDQAISGASSTEQVERAPGPGHKLQAREDSTANSTRGRVEEPQASSDKRQATSYKLPGPRPISNANKGLIHRRQASSSKLLKE